MTTVLLLHGLATNAARTWGETGWIDLVRDSGSPVIAPDLLGHALLDPVRPPRDLDGKTRLCGCVDVGKVAILLRPDGVVREALRVVD